MKNTGIFHQFMPLDWHMSRITDTMNVWVIKQGIFKTRFKIPTLEMYMRIFPGNIDRKGCGIALI
jgi:hypothetical protein